ncbi:MAG: Ig-like domain repeat protein, partial [Methanobrevibacter sp.]|nr:Ig-like domain repeat protein [Methanobrevibacter sp.]
TYYKNCSQGNEITVLPILSADDLVMKYRDGSQFKAKLVDGQGKAYAGQSVQFNINGVLYNRVTGSDGVAKLNINLMSGEYIITSSFNGFNTANKITIKS